MRRKIHKCLSFLLAAVLLASLAAPAALAAEGGDTVFVRTAEDLVQLAENCTLDSWSQGRIVRLEADIDLSGTDFTPIPTFGGTFEGQGHTISGLSITGSGNVRGLFRYIQPSGVVRDLSVEGRVDPSDRKNTLGGIAGSNRGLLAGCTFHGTVRGADSIGGLVGINESSGQIVNCTFSGAVTGEHYAGGIAGQNYGAVIQCRNSGSINTTEVDAELDLDAINRELQPTRMNDEELLKAITALVEREGRGGYLLPIQKMDTVNGIYKMYRGLGGLLDSILADENVTEVMINGPDNIFVERSGRLTRVDKHFKDEQELRRVIDLIVGKAHREVSEANPIVDTRLEDGSRVNVVLSPIALSGSTITIRKFSKQPMTMSKLLEYGSITPEVANFLKKLVAARYNIFIAGGTGSGKTTFLNALSNYIPHDERIITIEDSAELQITQIPNIVRLETRNATASSGESKKIDIQSLIRSSLRMRPDRIIVGEVRGAEALDMLQAMNTGHDGSLSTGHANSAEDMLSRLETMVLQGEAALPLKAIRQQISSAVDIMIHLSRLRDHSRKTMMVSEILPHLDENGDIRLNPLFEFREDEHSTLQHVSGALVRTENPMIQTDKWTRAGFLLEDIPAPVRK